MAPKELRGTSRHATRHLGRGLDHEPAPGDGGAVVGRRRSPRLDGLRRRFERLVQVARALSEPQVLAALPVRSRRR